MPDELDDWNLYGPKGIDALIDMSHTLTADGLLTPAVPPWMARSLLTTHRGFAWATNDHWSAWAGYSARGDVGPPTLPDCLEPGIDDFFLFAFRGYGQASYGIGLIARIGPLVISQSHSYGGGVYWEGGHMRNRRGLEVKRVNTAAKIWGRTLEELTELDQSGPARYLVEYSNFRRQTVLATSDPYMASASSLVNGLPDGWRFVVDGDEPGDLDQFTSMEDSRDTVLGIAARHLGALCASESASSDDD